jgi:hypothetical protein
MASCVLIAAFLRDHVSRPAARTALWLAALCPFTANYTALPMTETNSIFCVALAMFSSARLIGSIRCRERHAAGYIALTVASLICAVLLRPDGVVLSAAVIPAIWWYTRHCERRAGMKAALACILLVGLPSIPWTMRNKTLMHVFQPLAPRFANDPGEPVFPGYVRWTKTWLVDYVSSPEVYWRGDDRKIDIHLLPSRAFLSPADYANTDNLIFDYNEICTITPDLDAEFDSLALQKIKRMPLRYYVVMPMARAADMWIRPRTEYLIDDVQARWWEWRTHPAASLFAIGYALLNALLLTAAAIGCLRRRLPFGGMLVAFIVLRCLLLTSLENAEPRYTLECFPVVLASAAVAITSFGDPQSGRRSGPVAEFNAAVVARRGC